MDMAYEIPAVYTLGTVRELTEQEDKCSGSADSAFPSILSPVFADPCPPD